MRGGAIDGLEERDAAVLADLVAVVAALVGTEALDDRRRDASSRALAVQEPDALGQELDAPATRLRAAD